MNITIRAILKSIATADDSLTMHERRAVRRLVDGRVGPFATPDIRFTDPLSLTQKMSEKLLGAKGGKPRIRKVSSVQAANFGASLREIRRKLGYSQGQLAAAVGVSQQKLSEWERAKRLQGVVVAWRLAEFLARASV